MCIEFSASSLTLIRKRKDGCSCASGVDSVVLVCSVCGEVLDLLWRKSLA